MFKIYKHWANSLPLRIKLILPTWLLMTFGLICGGVAIIHVVVNELERSLLSRADVLANSAASNITPALAYENKKIIQEQLSDFTHDLDVVAVILTKTNGQQIMQLKGLPDSCHFKFNDIHCNATSLTKIKKTIELGDEVIGDITLYISLESVRNEFRRLLGILLIESLFFSFLTWFFAFRIYHFVTEPLKSLYLSMSHIVQQSTSPEPLPIKHNDEFGQLTQCFNDMIIRLADREDKLNATMEQLEQKSRYIYQVLDSMDQGLIVIAPDDEVTYYNPTAKKLLSSLGCDPTNLQQMIQMLEPSTLMDKLSEAIDAHIPLNGIEIGHKQSGRMFRARTVPMLTERHSLVQFEDITLHYISEHRRMLAELIFDQNQNALFVLSRKFEIQAQNAVSISTFGTLRSWHDISFMNALVIRFSDMKSLILNGNFQWYTSVLSIEGIPMPCRITAQKVASRKVKTEAIIVSINDQTVALELERLNHIAYHDPLTGLANRTHAFDRLVRDHDIGCNMHVLFVDLDCFKSINDKYGHHVGDELLKVVARRLSSNVSSNDFVARLSGDEFLLALKNSQDPEVIVQRLLAKLNETIHINGLVPKISASIGVCPWPAYDTTSLSVVIKNADRAMYEAKASGKNAYAIKELPALEWVL